ncbi:major facilitator superfamily transporter [Ceratobasidium sp. AG-Ba]|nr:major facilitator superfamily transporter [Ceratobasidium sp. AG-Ba]
MPIATVPPTTPQTSPSMATRDRVDSTIVESNPANTPQSSRAAITIEDQSHRLQHKKLLLVLSSLTLCSFVSYLDQTSVSTVLPAIAHDLGAADRINWVGISFLVATTSSQIVIARLSDIFGRKALLISVIVLFTLGNLLCGFAKTAVWLFIARGIAGIGGGGINSVVSIILTDLVSLKDLGKYSSILITSVALGSGIGPLLGGALSTAGWRWVFWFTVPITVACIVQLWWMLPQNKMSGNLREKLRMVDFIGSSVSLAAVVLLLVPLSGGGIYYSWNSAFVISMIAVGSVLAVLFILVEWRVAALPILPLYLFRIRNVFIVSATTFLTGIVFFCNLYFLPSYYTDVRGFSPVQAGLYLLPLVVVQVFAVMLSGQLLSRTRYPRPYIVGGFAIWTIGAGLQSMFGLGTSKGKIIGYLILEGIGIGFTFQTTILAAQASAPSPERAVITGSRNFFRSLGGAIGLVATKNAVLKKELLAIPGLSAQAAASIIKLGPQALTDSSLDGAVRSAYMSSIRAVFILFIPVAGLSVIMSLFMKSVYLQGDKDVLPVTKTPTPPTSQDNLELRNMGGEGDNRDSIAVEGRSAEKSFK